MDRKVDETRDGLVDVSQCTIGEKDYVFISNDMGESCGIPVEEIEYVIFELMKLMEDASEAGSAVTEMSSKTIPDPIIDKMVREYLSEMDNTYLKRL